MTGVDILTDTGSYRSTYDILLDISKVWKDISDVDQAALLEIIAGKTRSNTAAAILSNTKDLEEALLAAQEAEGSAIRENEKYLDSIQGKLDKFNNALQTMWSNFVSADAVKFVVEFGTNLIKIVDTLGLIPSILITIASFKALTSLFKGADIIGFIKSISALTMGTKVFEAETRRASFALMEETINTQLASSALGEYAIKMHLAKASDIAKMTTTQLLGLGFKTLGASIVGATKAMIAFLLTNPVGWVILAIGAVASGIAIFNHFYETTEELTEELNNLKIELQDIQSEIESLNSELETVQNRMTELLSMDKLSFTEEEELKRLRKQNDELQREIDLQKTLQNSKQKEVNVAFKEVMQKKLDKNYTKDNVNGFNGTYTKKSNLLSALVHGQVSGEEALRTNIDQYLSKVKLVDSLEEQSIHAQSIINDPELSWFDKLGQKAYITSYENGKESLDALEKSISDQLLEYKSDIEGIEYGDDEEVNAYLDYVNNMLDRWAITSGGENAKTNALSRIFNKDENAAISDSIDDYVEALKKGDTSAKTSIENIIKNNKALVEDIEASGLSLDDAVNYFTSFASEANYATIDGKLKEVDEATRRLKTALSENFDVSNLDSIKQALTDKGWVDSDGNLMSDVIAEYFGGENGGISEKTRTEIERLVKQIYDGKISVDDALKSFELFGVQSVIDIQVTEVKTNFNDVFSDLEDIDGLVDTFEELGEAINSTLGALEAFNQAQADAADKGFVSIQTALQLMEYTDDYSSILEVVDGKLQLVKNAEQNLIQARINAIKVSAETAVADAQAAYDKAELAVQSYRSAMVEEASASTVATAWQKIVAVAAGIKNALDNIWSGESIGSLYNSGYNSYLESATGYEIKYDDAGLQSLQEALIEADNKLKEAKDNAAIADALTSDNLEDIYKPSDKSTKEEVTDDLFQKEMDYWENRIAANQAKRDQIQNEIDLLESQGKRAGEEYYKELIALEEERKELLMAQRNEALAYLSTQEEGSEEWWNAASIVNDLEGEIDDATASIQDFADAQAQIKWDNLEEITSRFSNLHDEISDLRYILQREDMFDEDGNWTESGAAVLGTYVHDLEVYKNELATLQSEIADLQAHPYNEANAAYLKETYSIDSEQEYNDLVTQWNQAQRDIVKGAYDTADAIKDSYSQQVDAIEDAINEQIDAYNDYIDVVKEAYDAERELYEFKKDIQKQSKSIAETERRIASLSGSTNAADIAERRKLEAQLAEQRESINDSYYSHANDSRSNALDNEAQAYEDSMNRYVEGLRETLEEQDRELITFNETGAMVTNEFLNGVTATVLENAGIILTKYEEVSPYMSDELKQPWIDASAQLGQYGNDLSVLNAWTADSGYFGKFKTTASGQVTTPFVNGSAAASAFKTSTTSAMDSIASNVRSNVSNITSNLGSVKSAYSGIITTANQAKAAIDAANAAAAAGANYTGTAANPSSTVVAPQQVDNRILSKYKLTSDQVLALGYGPISLEKFEDLLRSYLIKYSNKFSKAQIWNTTVIERSIRSFGANYVSGPLAVRQYAKGTMGTTHDEWAITDEPRFGDELVLVPGKDGNLSFMRKGTSVVPAEITTNLMEWGQFTPDAMNLGGGVNVNMITNSVMKPQYDLSFDSLVHVDNCSQETLKDLEKMVDNKINKFSKELNYSIKKFAR